MKKILLFLILPLFLFSKDIYFEGGKMSLEDLAISVSIETKQDIILHESLKNKIVYLRVGKTISDLKLLDYFKYLLEANGLSLNRKNGFYIVTPVTDLVYYSYRFKNRKASDFKTHIDSLKELCSLGNDVLFCNATPKDIKRIMKMVKSYDIPIPRNPYEYKTIKIDMNIIESSYNDLLDLKNELSLGIKTNNFHVDSSASDSLFLSLSAFLNGASVLDTLSLNYIFNYLESNGISNIMNKPNILVTNGFTTSITTGGTQRVISSTTKNDDLSADTTNYEDFVSGLQLSVKADIISDTKFKLEITLNNENVIGGTVQLPITSKQSYQTVITLDKNETVVLGGVIYEKNSTENSKVPFLGDIPILGFPFNSKNEVKEKRVLTIALTVKDYK